MTRSFFNGLSGMKSFQSGIDITANNLSNINTIGYKESKQEFSSIFSQTLKTSPITSDIGLGSHLKANAIDISEGSIIDSDSPFHIALGGEGWLSVQKENKQYFTRNGAFKKDKEGFLVDDNGDYLLVANANNIKNSNGIYEIDTKISTQNLINNSLSPISLPDNLILKAVATSKVDLKANLNNEITTYDIANKNSDLSALYSQTNKDLQVRDNDSFIFGFSNNLSYSYNLLSSEICINDDKKDGKDLIFDFSINGKKIDLTLKDGATKEEIQNALLEKLQENGINAKKSENGIIISDSTKIILISNNNNLENIAAEKLIYKTNPQNENEFNTLGNLIEKMNNLAKNENENLNVSLEKGKIIINNLTDTTIKSHILKSENSNKNLLENLKNLDGDIFSKTSAKSYEFRINKKNFAGDIFDKDGNKERMEFSFVKSKVLENKTEWEGIITVKNNKGEVLNKTKQIFTFNDKGNLISNNKLLLNSPQKIEINFDLTSYMKIDKSIYSFSQNGREKGFLKDYTISEDGKIIANFSNSKSIPIAQIPIFHFQNPQGLESIGGNLFKQTVNSNKAFLYKKDGKYIPNAKILSNKLESSNVNFAEAMTELIINQKAFSAAAKTVTTSDEMIQKAINLKR